MNILKNIFKPEKLSLSNGKQVQPPKSKMPYIILAISIFTFGIVAKMIYEKIETIDMGAFEAMEAAGATKLQAFCSAIMPQILPTYLSTCLYSFEINVRYATILGYVGAGGISLILNEKIGWREYDKIGMILVMLFITVVLIEYTSKYIREKLS
ncbi:MAG: ABC transporter permease subunit [Clostridium sp.]|nr:ABC transporter permease subunit [Clostridium sp.]